MLAKRDHFFAQCQGVDRLVALPDAAVMFSEHDGIGWIA